MSIHGTSRKIVGMTLGGIIAMAFAVGVHAQDAGSSTAPCGTTTAGDYGAVWTVATKGEASIQLRISANTASATFPDGTSLKGIFAKNKVNGRFQASLIKGEKPDTVIDFVAPECGAVSSAVVKSGVVVEKMAVGTVYPDGGVDYDVVSEDSGTATRQ